MDGTKIQWTDATWNPVRGCSRVSEGCRNCYAERMAARFSGPGQPHEGLASHDTGRWTGEVRLVPERLGDPLRWRRPRRIFVNSMSDLFHERLSDEQIAAVFGVMARASQHTFQVLTKRPERMLSFFARGDDVWTWQRAAERAGVDVEYFSPANCQKPPLLNVWLGVSVEDQATANERIPILLDCPATIRWVSYEPAIGPVDFSRWVDELDWIVIGGESGPGARPFDLAWARDVLSLRECQIGEVACFVKQLGARPIVAGFPCFDPATGKHGDPAAWPADLRVREYPR